MLLVDSNNPDTGISKVIFDTLDRYFEEKYSYVIHVFWKKNIYDLLYIQTLKGKTILISKDNSKCQMLLL